MLSRLISICRPSLSLSRRLLSLHFHSPPSPAPSPPSRPHFFTPRFFSAAGSSNGDDGPQSTFDAWNLTSENDDLGVFGDLKDEAEPSWSEEREGSDAWASAVGAKPWSVGGDEKVEDVFALGEEKTGGVVEEALRGEADKETVDLVALLKEEEALTAVLKGPNRAFGDLVAASGISDAMLDSLMALKNFDEIVGLPPLAEIEDIRYVKSLKNSSRAEMERLKQEEIAKSRVRTVDELGRAYGTGKRKCSIARVWIQPGDGKFVVNDKEFDVYFPMLDHRAALLRPFSETKTLGLWDVKCTVKGGGVSGQVGAVRLGVSRALQNWEPGLRPPLREAGFLTRDSRVVERKKPGKAKARKSFQWVKR